jgi:hopanoid biosynthesis associated RND transporter like protein HpnN
MMSEHIPAEEASLIRRFLHSLVGLVCRFPLAVLVLSLAAAGLSLGAAATRLQYFTQRNDLMSPHKDYQQRWRQYLGEFGDDDDIVAVIKGNDRAQMERALEAVAAEVRKQPEHFDRLFYKVDLRSLRKRALMFLSSAEIRSIQDNLRGMGLLLQLGPIGWRNLTLTGLLHEANARASRLKPGDILSPADEQFFTQLLSISRVAHDVLADPAAYHTPWSSLIARQPDQEDLLAEPQYFFSSTKKDPADKPTLAFLLVRPLKEKGSFTAALSPVTAMRQIIERTRLAFPEVEFGLTGLPVLETDEMSAADHDTRLASWLAIAGVSLLFLLVYRRIWYPLLTVATLLLGTAWAMGWLTATVGHLNILSATFAVMLIGMGDYGVLWVMRYEQARRQGMDVRSALLHTTTHVAIGNLTAASTLALAFFAAMLADFQAVAELGWIAGCGVLLCAFACFTVLPALLMLCDRRGAMGQPEGAILPFPGSAGKEAWLPVLGRCAGWVVAGGLLLTAGMGWCAWRNVSYDHNLLHLQAADLESVQWELTLIEHTAGASWHSLSICDTPEEALRLKAMYERMPDEVSRVVEVASLIPPEQDEKMQMLRDVQRRLRSLPKRGEVIPHAVPELPPMNTEIVRLLEQLKPLTDRPDVPREALALLANLRSSMAALYVRLEAVPKEHAVPRLQDFEQRLAGDLAEDLHRLREVSHPIPIHLADLPAELRERYVGKSGKWLLRVFALKSLWDFPRLEQFTHKIRAVDPQATGKPFGTVEGLKAMKSGLERAGLYAFAVITAVLLIDFRSWKRLLVALAPLVMGVVLTLGVMGLLHFPLNPANMIAFPLILGVGVDNGVHVLHDYLLRRQRGGAPISHAIGRGVLVKAMTTMIGFGTLMISTERGLAGLGFILTVGVGCSMVSALIFLPAALHLFRKQPRRLTIIPDKRSATAYRQSA